MRKYTLYQIDAFTKEKFKGNPAGVVVNADGISEIEMQKIARELNNSETAFLFSPTASDHDVWIRFFTPTIEVPVCGHATIASHFVRALELHLGNCQVRHRVGTGIFPVDIIKEGNDYKITMTQGRLEFDEPFHHEISADIINALGLVESELDSRCPIQIVSTGHSKVMVGIKSLSRLNALQPNQDKLIKMSSQIGCNGFFVFTLDSNDASIFAHGRMFAPAIGISEDPVTGNANGPFGAYAVRHNLCKLGTDGKLQITNRQGEAMGRPGTVEVQIEQDSKKQMVVKIAGHAVVFFKTEIEL